MSVCTYIHTCVWHLDEWFVLISINYTYRYLFVCVCMFVTMPLTQVCVRVNILNEKVFCFVLVCLYVGAFGGWVSYCQPASVSNGTLPDNLLCKWKQLDFSNYWKKENQQQQQSKICNLFLMKLKEKHLFFFVFVSATSSLLF